MPDRRALAASRPALDVRQAEAVAAPPGPLLVLAGAGSGKTRVLTERAGELVARHDQPAETLLVITFTNRAADELRSRLHGLVGEAAGRMTIGTFHAVCHCMLRAHAQRAGRSPRFSVYDAQQSRRLIARALKQLGAGEELPVRLVALQIGQAKARLLGPDQYRALRDSGPTRLVAATYERYERALERSEALDFDDLIVRAVTLLGEPDLAARYQRRWGGLLVDEYQDTNPAQYEWIRRLSERHRNITVVGDDDQCVAEGTMITMADGSRRLVEHVRPGDLVLSSHGHGCARAARVLRVAQRTAAEGVAITTESGRQIVATPEHTHFAGYVARQLGHSHLSYLMWRGDMGFRVGTARGCYKLKCDDARLGPAHRGLHEQADAVWVISHHTDAVEARLEEARLAARYGLPVLPFRAVTGGHAGSGLAASQTHIDRLYGSLDTEGGGRQLLQDVGLDFERPDYRPAARTANSRDGRTRHVVTVTLCAERRGDRAMHRVSVHGSDGRGREELERVGLNPRPLGGGARWRYTSLRRHYGEVLGLAELMSARLGAPVRQLAAALRAPGQRRQAVSLPFARAAQVRPGMVMATPAGQPELVVEVARIQLDAPVYDLDVEGTHNFVADGVVTHNSIYGFRGADIGHLLSFERDFPDARLVKLERNYRSRGAIVEAAARLVLHNRRRRAKAMWTDASPGPAVGALACADEQEEARAAAAWCAARLGRGVPAEGLAVLVRTRAQLRALEDALLLAGIPCRVVGGQGLWESQAVRDLVAHLTLLVNPRDELALARALACQPGIGEVSVGRVRAAAVRHTGDLVATCVAADGIGGLRGRQRLAVEAFGRTLGRLGRAAERDGVATTCTDVVLGCGLAGRLARQRTERAEEQLERLRRFCRGARGYEATSETPNLADFLAQAALASDDGEASAADRVTLSTIHAAKGCEWNHVRIAGLCEGLLPHHHALERGEVDEERRLAYVGFTRARRELALSWPRVLRGRPARASRFLAEAGLAPFATQAPALRRAA